MTALRKYQRIEATALWRADGAAQRREVIVSIGEATLVISDLRDRALAHWSLAAIQRANPGQLPALYHPDGDPEENLEFPEDEVEMVAAIEKLRSAIEKSRPRPGRLRLLVAAVALASTVAAATLWLPDALVYHTVGALPPVKRSEIGQALMGKIEHLAGKRCHSPRGAAVLNRLAVRLDQDVALAVLPLGQRQTIQLPGNLMVINATLVEDYEDPDIAAGYILAEALRAEQLDPLVRLLQSVSLMDNLRLLTTGSLPEDSLGQHAVELLTALDGGVDSAALLQAFEAVGVKSSPYAYALDVSGETSVDLIEADPFPGAAPSPVLSDADWLRLQSICEG